MDRYKLVSEQAEIFSLEVPNGLKHLANDAVELINNLMKDYKLEPVFNVPVFKGMFNSRMNVFRTDFSIEAIPHADRVIITWYKQTASIKETRENICKETNLNEQINALKNSMFDLSILGTQSMDDVVDFKHEVEIDIEEMTKAGIDRRLVDYFKSLVSNLLK